MQLLRNAITALLLVILFSCTQGTKENSQTHESDSAHLMNANETRANLSFESKNYLKVSKMTRGRVFKDAGVYVFLRIIEIPLEGALTIYVEKIGVEEDGISLVLLNRYSIEDIKLNLEESYLYALDSLKFTDSVTVSGYFNKLKRTIDLNNKVSK